jgi:hypothetical protein
MPPHNLEMFFESEVVFECQLSVLDDSSLALRCEEAMKDGRMMYEDKN